MFETITAFVTGNLFEILGVGGIGVSAFLAWLLKKFDKDAFSKRLDDWMRNAADPKDPAKIFKGIYYAGKVATGWFVNLPVIGFCWNKVVEPLLIFFIDLVLKVVVWFVVSAIMFFKNGLMSDNTNFGNQSKTEASKANRGW